MDLGQMLEASRVALMSARLRKVRADIATMEENFTTTASAKFRQQIALAKSKNEIDVTISFDVQGKNEQSTEVLADLGIEYGGKFSFNGDRAQIVSFLGSREFQYALVSQVQPLAVVTMLSLMGSMGIQINSNVRLGFPLMPDSDTLERKE